jgi:hypothetical protein
MAFATSIEAIVKMLARKDAIIMKRALRDLEGAGVISERQRLSWEIRNSVMHGNLLSLYSNEEEDAALLFAYR